VRRRGLERLAVGAVCASGSTISTIAAARGQPTILASNHVSTLDFLVWRGFLRRHFPSVTVLTHEYFGRFPILKVLGIRPIQRYGVRASIRAATAEQFDRLGCLVVFPQRELSLRGLTVHERRRVSSLPGAADFQILHGHIEYRMVATLRPVAVVTVGDQREGERYMTVSGPKWRVFLAGRAIDLRRVNRALAAANLPKIELEGGRPRCNLSMSEQTSAAMLAVLTDQLGAGAGRLAFAELSSFAHGLTPDE
jgi:hypothetical protein